MDGAQLPNLPTATGKYVTAPPERCRPLFSFLDGWWAGLAADDASHIREVLLHRADGPVKADPRNPP